jgi:hypothetical protein
MLKEMNLERFRIPLWLEYSFHAFWVWNWITGSFIVLINMETGPFVERCILTYMSVILVSYLKQILLKK